LEDFTHFLVRPLPRAPGGKFSGALLGPIKSRWNRDEIYFRFWVIVFWNFRKNFEIWSTNFRGWYLEITSYFFP